MANNPNTNATPEAPAPSVSATPNETLAGAAPQIMADAAPAVATAKPAEFFAHTDVIHDGRVIKKGEKLPEKFPIDSIALLRRDRAIGLVPPAATVVQHAREGSLE